MSAIAHHNGYAGATPTRTEHVASATQVREPLTNREVFESTSDEPTPDVLTDLEWGILQFESKWWRYSGVKETAILELFDIPATRYYQILNTLLDNPAALAAQPLLVKRLRRLRDQRHRDRSARRLPAGRR